MNISRRQEEDMNDKDELDMAFAEVLADVLADVQGGKKGDETLVRDAKNWHAYLKAQPFPYLCDDTGHYVPVCSVEYYETNTYCGDYAVGLRLLLGYERLSGSWQTDDGPRETRHLGQLGVSTDRAFRLLIPWVATGWINKEKTSVTVTGWDGQAWVTDHGAANDIAYSVPVTNTAEPSCAHALLLAAFMRMCKSGPDAGCHSIHDAGSRAAR
jgi:hypothetical protein